MHMQTQSVQALNRPAPQNANHDSVARVDEMTKQILAIHSGEAPISVVYEWAFKALALASEKVGSIDLGGIDSMDRDEARAALDEIQSGRDYLRSITPFFEKYPYFTAVLKFHADALFYAEATLIPFYMLGNSAAVESGAASVSTYIVRHPITRMIKIGRASDVPARIKALQTGAGAILSTLAVIPADVEQELHKRFAGLRRHGEWFQDVDGAISEYAKTQEVA